MKNKCVKANDKNAMCFGTFSEKHYQQSKSKNKLKASLWFHTKNKFNTKTLFLFILNHVKKLHFEFLYY